MEREDSGSKRKALGRGLKALISPSAVPVSALIEEGGAARDVRPHHIEGQHHLVSESGLQSGEGVKLIPIEKIDNNPSQPRQTFQEEELNELAQSIKSLGILQPVLVRAVQGRYQIVAGERRWRAAQRAGLKEVPALVKELDEKQTLQIALVENVQREQLNPIEEALAYQRLAVEHKLSQDEIADLVGKNRTSVANFLRLLKLPKEVVGFVQDNKISMGHAKAILTVREPAVQTRLARKVLEEGLSVRALEAIVSRSVVLEAPKEPLTKNSGGHKKQKEKLELEETVERLRRRLGTKVNIQQFSHGGGKLEISYFSEEELDRLIELICQDET